VLHLEKNMFLFEHFDGIEESEMIIRRLKMDF
jgi:hypothetical protein